MPLLPGFLTNPGFLYITIQKHHKINYLMKKAFRYLPFKPLWKFMLDYFFWRGFLDGYRGFAWALIQAFYVWLSYFKLCELKQGITTLPKEYQDD